MHKMNNLNIKSINELPSPNELIEKQGRSKSRERFIIQSRNEISEILFGNDKRLLLVVGPCSIHDIESGLEYARNFKKLSESVKDRFLLVMRAYFEKPRTSVGWKGLILDPYLDQSSDILNGLTMARQFLSELIDMEIPTATELLDPITPQYIADLISWSAIGARTTQSQIHRQLASGLSMPLGFKNTTSGSFKAAVHAILAAQHPQTFMGISEKGRASYIITHGNPHCHIVLRGGLKQPNYDPESIQIVEEELKMNNLQPSIMIDCSHDNCAKEHQKQIAVFNSVIKQIQRGNNNIKALMLESNIHAGNQSFPQQIENLKYGVSITDPCIDWETTISLINSAYKALEHRFISINTEILSTV
jgi:3-deoxy-7-phosphoheptulonate synthase